MEKELEEKLMACNMDDDIYDLGFRCVGHIPALVADTDDLTMKEVLDATQHIYARKWLWKKDNTCIKTKDLGNTYCSYVGEVGCGLIEKIRDVIRAQKEVE